MTNFHAQLGERVRTRDALRVASSFFSDGLEKFKAGELELALSLEQAGVASHVVCCMSHVTCCMSHVTCCMSHAACCMLHVAYHMPHVTFCMALA